MKNYSVHCNDTSRAYGVVRPLIEENLLQMQPGEDFSISFWYKKNKTVNTTFNDHSAFVFFENFNSENQGYNIGLREITSTDYYLTIVVQDFVNTYEGDYLLLPLETIPSFSISDDWVHVVVLFDRDSDIQLYVNANLIPLINISNRDTFDEFENFPIGPSSNTNMVFMDYSIATGFIGRRKKDFYVDSFGIFKDTLLTVDDINFLYNNGKGFPLDKYWNNLVFGINFKEGQDIVSKDVTGNFEVQWYNTDSTFWQEGTLIENNVLL